MTKKKWISLGIIVVCAAIVLTLFSYVFKAKTGVALPWWAYPVALLIYGLIVYLVILIAERVSKRFDALLEKNNFNADKKYRSAEQLLYIDFNSKRLANTYISTKPIVQFSDIAGYRFETYQKGATEDLPDDRRFVSLVLSVKREDADYEYLYIPMFEIAVAVEDIGDGIKEISPELLEKYPELSDMSELEADVKKILEINAADGVTSNVRKD